MTEVFPKVVKKKYQTPKCLRCGQKEKYLTPYLARMGLCADCYKDFKVMFKKWCAEGKK